jgi:hypothetical protein
MAVLKSTKINSYLDELLFMTFVKYIGLTL